MAGKRGGRSRVKVIHVHKQKGVTEVVLHEQKGKRIRAIVLPPGSSTGRHREERDYYLHSLTGGTLHVEIFKTVRGKEQRKVEVRRLKPHQGYRRKVGRGVEINVTNKSRGHHIFSK